MGHANLCSPVTSIPPDGQSSRVRDCHDGDWLCLPRVCWTDSQRTDFRTISAKSERTYGKRWIFPFFSFFGKSVNYLYGSDLSIFGFNEFYTMFEILVGIANFMKELVDWSNFSSFVEQIVIFEECEINIELNFSKELPFYFRLVDAAVWNSFRGIEN